MFYRISARLRKVRITNRVQIIISLALIFTGLAGSVFLVYFL